MAYIRREARKQTTMFPLTLDGQHGKLDFLLLIDILPPLFMSLFSVGEKVRRERRWTSAGAAPARELVRSTR
jgi:hypothetical protein